jgi:hypothetical protein
LNTRPRHRLTSRKADVNLPDGSLDLLQRELDAAGNGAGKLARSVDTLRRRLERLSTLRAAAPAEAAQLRALESSLDFDRTTRHVAAACAAAAMAADPVPHLVVREVFPPEVYAAIVGAIPEPVFFEEVAAGAYELGVPPRLAPFHAMVTWEFVKAVVLHAFSAALIARLHEPLAAFAQTRFPGLPPFDRWNVEVTLSRGRLIRRCPGCAAGSGEDRPWDLLTTIIELGGSPDDGPSGGVLRPPASSPAELPAEARTVNVPAVANGALAFVGPSAAYEYAAVPHRAPAQAVRHSYEFGIGPTREGRRTLRASASTR